MAFWCSFGIRPSSARPGFAKSGKGLDPYSNTSGLALHSLQVMRGSSGSDFRMRFSPFAFASAFSFQAAPPPKCTASYIVPAMRLSILKSIMASRNISSATCRAQNCNLESFSLTTLSSISLLLVRQHAGEVNVSLFAVGLCCRHAAKAVADRRQSLPPPTTAGPAAPQAAAAPHGFGPTFLDPGVSVVRQLANLSAHRKTRNRAALAPAGVAELLASAFKPERQDGPP